MTNAGSMAVHAASAGAPVGRRGWDDLQFSVIFALSFLAHVVVATGRRASPRFWAAAARRPLLSEAWAASATTARLAFAG